jgi:hypothetical protein
MGVYLSVFLLPFYLTLNYYHFKLVYIFNFAAFVVSSSCLAMMATAFFKDLKIASEMINLMFSISSFLPLIYQGGDGSGSIPYKAIDYIAMVMPNSAFSISIM